MRSKSLPVLALAIAGCFPDGAIGFEADFKLDVEAASEERKDPRETPLPALGSGIPPVAIIAAGLAAAAALAAGASGGGGGGGAGVAAPAGGGSAAGGSGNGASTAPRTLSYSSAGDFRTSEFSAQQGLQLVKADSLYYNGHYSWYAGNAPSAAAGTGIGVKIAVADTGINAREASTGSAISIDVAASYDYVADRAGAGADEYGHGTHVAGIIAAPKNGSGMHGLAYNASLVNFKVGNGPITATDAQLADMMNRAANAGAMIINNSWAAPASPITSFSREQLESSMPLLIEGSRAYVAKGGVVVFAAGNDAAAQPALHAGLPHRITGIEPGWLAVVAIDVSGTLAGYSNRCGVAAAWCLAAPGGGASGGLYSMQNNGGYASLSGTSMAAPHAAAAIGALKSMFVNLSYLQIRDRLLYTANRSGTYADASAYGQGLMDLDAASSPVGGVAVPTGTSASGATAAVAGSGIAFQPGALRTLRMQSWVLVVDNYQRAPFWMAADTFFREATPPLIERQWASLRSAAPGGRLEKIGPRLRLSHSPGLNDVVSADLATYRLGFSKGAGGEAILGSHLELAWLPQLAAPGTDSTAVGYASDFRGVRIGLLGTLPSAQATSERTVESSSLGSRRALGMVAQHRDTGTTYGASLAVAEHFERPIGIAASGAFGVGDSAAVSSGAFVQRAVGRDTVLEASLEIARHRTEANGPLTAPGYALRTVSLGARTALGARTTVSAGLKREWTGGEAARLQVPLTIAENGDIGRVTYALPYDELVGRSTLTLRIDHALKKQVDLRASVTRERYGFGTTVTGIAAILEIVN
jgi:subtilisin family serine protease